MYDHLDMISGTQIFVQSWQSAFADITNNACLPWPANIINIYHSLQNIKTHLSWRVHCKTTPFPTKRTMYDSEATFLGSQEPSICKVWYRPMPAAFLANVSVLMSYCRKTIIYNFVNCIRKTLIRPNIHDKWCHQLSCLNISENKSITISSYDLHTPWLFIPIWICRDTMVIK